MGKTNREKGKGEVSNVLLLIAEATHLMNFAGSRIGNTEAGESVNTHFVHEEDLYITWKIDKD